MGVELDDEAGSALDASPGTQCYRYPSTSLQSTKAMVPGAGGDTGAQVHPSSLWRAACSMVPTENKGDIKGRICCSAPKSGEDMLGLQVWMDTRVGLQKEKGWCVVTFLQP